MMRSTFFAAVVAVSLASVDAAAYAPDIEGMDLVLKAMPAGPIARVNGEDIAQEEFGGLYMQEIAMLKARAGGREVPKHIRLDTGLACLRMLVQRELLRQEAVRRNIQIPENELDERYNTEMQAMKNAFSGPSGQEPTEQQVLEAAGATREEAREELRNVLIIEKTATIIAEEQNVTVTDSEMREFFEEHRAEFKRPERVHLHQIYTGFRNNSGDENVKAEARQKIERAIGRIHAGESFGAVARAVSESPDREIGGDLGPMPAETLPPFYIEEAKRLQPGEISGVIESQYGFHVIKLVEMAGGGDVTFEQAKPMIENMLLAHKTEMAVARWCDQFMQKPDYVQIFLQVDRIMEAHPELRDAAQQLLVQP